MSKTILIVDDSASLRQVVSIALKGGGYNVIEGCDGQDGLDKLKGNKVHLIVSDVNRIITPKTPFLFFVF